MIDYSVILPCYNEAENIPVLLSGFSAFMSNENAELVLVNNGSTDNTILMEEGMKCRYPFLKWVNIDTNIGYGYGIYTGLNHAKGKIFGYTHADLQADPNDVLRAISVIKTFPEENSFLLKGFRENRGWTACFFSRVFELLASVILKYKFREINAQPVFFSSDVMKSLSKPPVHWGFDLYVYYIALKINCKITRIKVKFTERKHGVSKWQTGYLPRLRLSLKMLQYCVALKKEQRLTHFSK